MIWRISDKLGTGLKDKLIGISLLLLSVLGIMRFIRWDVKDAIGYSTNGSTVTAAVLLIVIVVCSTDRCIRPDEIRIISLFWAGWILCFSMILLTSLFNDVYSEYIIWAAISLLFFPVFILAWSVRPDYERLCIRLAQYIMIVSDVFFVLNLLLLPFFPKEKAQSFHGLANNPNANGLIAIAACTAALFLLLLNKQRPFVCIITIGFCFGLARLSYCRLAQYTMIIQIALGFIYCFRNTKRGRPRRKLLLLLAIAAVAVMILSPLTAAALQYVRLLDLNSYAADSAAAVSYDGNSAVLGLLDRTLTGRIGIWKAFLSGTTFWGNGTPTEPLTELEASVYAHNHVIEILYTSGVLAAVGYILFLLSGISLVIRCMMNKPGYRSENLLALLAFTGYFVVAMLEIMIYPTSNTISLLLYMSMVPIAMHRKKRKRREN